MLCSLVAAYSGNPASPGAKPVYQYVRVLQSGRGGGRAPSGDLLLAHPTGIRQKEADTQLFISPSTGCGVNQEARARPGIHPGCEGG